MSVQVCWVRPPGDKDEPSDQFTDAHIQSSCVRWGANYKMLMSPQSKASIVSFKIITTNNIIGRNIFFQTSPKLKKHRHRWNFWSSVKLSKTLTTFVLSFNFSTFYDNFPTCSNFRSTAHHHHHHRVTISQYTTNLNIYEQQYYYLKCWLYR